MPVEEKDGESRGSKHYRMLQKARLAEDLFGGDQENPLEVDAQPEEPSLALPDLALPEMNAELDLKESAEVLEPLLDDRPLSPDEDPLSEVVPAPETVVAPSRTPVDWRAELANLVGAESLANCRSIGVCAVAKDPGGAAMTVALGRWIAERAQEPTLIIEANAHKPRLTRLMRGRRRGLTEILFDQMGRDEALSSWEGDELRLLPLGRNLDRKRRRAFNEKLAENLTALRGDFKHVLVELPAANHSALKTFPVSEAVDAVLLVVDAKRSTKRQVVKAAARLRKLGLPLAGCLIDGEGSGSLGRSNRTARRLG